MSKTWPHRPPAVFRLDDDHVMVGLAKDDAARRAVQVIPEPDTETSVIAVDDPLQWRRRGFRWGALFWGALGGLILLAAGLGVVRLIEDLFARNQEFGFLGLALAVAGRGRVFGRRHSRDHGAGAACDHREASSARLGYAFERRSPGGPRRRARAIGADAPHAAARPRPRRDGEPSWRYHRRRRHGAARRARTHVAAGSAGASRSLLRRQRGCRHSPR